MDASNSNESLNNNVFEENDPKVASGDGALKEQHDVVTAEAEVEGAQGEEYTTDEASEVNSEKNCLLKMLDEMEGRVEELRADATKVEAERDDVLASLDTLINSQLVHNLDGTDLDEVKTYLKRLIRRCFAVKVEISTERSLAQEESLHLVNTLIDAMIGEAKVDVATAKRKCVSYMNSCSDVFDPMFEEDCGIDSEFEAAVLGCTIEDQKRVKKRLSGLYSYFSFSPSPSLSELEIQEEEEEVTD